MLGIGSGDCVIGAGGSDNPCEWRHVGKSLLTGISSTNEKKSLIPEQLCSLFPDPISGAMRAKPPTTKSGP